MADDRARPGGRGDRGADRRGVLAEVLVQRVLVLQAAHQPPARPRDPQRVHRQVLVLGHPDRHRLEVLQEGGAAQVAPARPDPALQPRLVPRADLPQLHPGLQPPAQVADQRAEVNPVRRAEVDDEHVLESEVVHRGDLHRQLVLPDQPARGQPPLGPPRAVLLVPGQVVLAGQARAHRQPADLIGHPLRRPHALGHLGPGVGGHEHLVADGRRVRARGRGSTAARTARSSPPSSCPQGQTTLPADWRLSGTDPARDASLDEGEGHFFYG